MVVLVLLAAFTANAARAASAPRTRPPLRTLAHDPWASDFAFAPDGKTLASGGATGDVKLWNVASGELKRTFPAHPMLRAIAYTPDGKTIVTSASDDGTSNEVKLWNAETATLVRTIKHATTVNQIAFTPDGKRMATAQAGGNLLLWDTATWKVVQTTKVDDETLYAVAVSPDGKNVATGGGLVIMRGAHKSHTLRLFDAASGKETVPLDCSRSVLAVAFSPDGKTLAAGSLDATLQLWNTATGTLAATLKWPTKETAPVSAVAFSPDGQELAAAAGRRIHVWHVPTGMYVAPLGEHEATVGRMAFSPDGEVLAASDNFGGGTVKLWSTPSGKRK
jgi:WD40 repeat protein